MNVQDVSWFFTLPVLVLAMAITFVRLVRGPSLPDRVVALDLMGTLSIGVMTVYAVATEHAVYLDVAIVLTLISFLGTIAFAYYVRRRGRVE
jgi:multicomponent Na+:H+ antiporter subunit F